MSKYKGIIFDLDGVICHTDCYHYQAWKTIADELGIYFDEKINNRLRGVSRMDSLEILLERYEGTPFTEEEKKQLAEKKNAVYVSLLNNMQKNDLSVEVKDTLGVLKKAGIKVAIGSSSKNAKLILYRLGLEHFFDAVSDGNNISKSKPDPEVFLCAAEYLNLAPEECLVVEDAKAGIEAARRGGFSSAGIGEAASEGMADYPLQRFSDLLLVVGDIDERK